MDSNDYDDAGYLAYQQELEHQRFEYEQKLEQWKARKNTERETRTRFFIQKPEVRHGT